ncbi:MAG: 2-dehydro-3-deoxyglucarate aldolase [Planctomycetes bacterium]|nr:2-dehydro-3-deoxyglucarate aldolase [Planctomycetota bacterium]
MRTNWVREKLCAGQPTLGCFLGLGSPNVAELLAHAGFDWLVVETEHNALDSAQIEHMLMAMNGTETIPLVRVPSSEPVFIQRALDIGAMGVVVPLVKTAAEAQGIVRATRYPPHGTRSFGPLRASHYTFDNQDYLNRANDNILVVLILETKEAAENLEAITAVPGVDAIYLGPFDLCLSLGLNPMQLPLPEIDRAFERALGIGRNSGVAVGAGASTPEQLRQRQAQGCTFLGYGPDYLLMADAARAGLAAFVRPASGGAG